MPTNKSNCDKTFQPGYRVRITLETTILNACEVENITDCWDEIDLAIISTERLRPELEGSWDWETDTSIVIRNGRSVIARLEREDGCTHVYMDQDYASSHKNRIPDSIYEILKETDNVRNT